MSNQAKVILGIIVAIALIYGLFAFDVVYKDKVDDFATCVAAGNPVMESYPRQCRDKDGELYVEEIGRANADIRVSAPVSGATISSPVTVSGEARGTWFFEASFPVKILGADGTVLGQGPVQAQGEWMTTEFVPFTASISFNPGNRTSGIVRFMKDNPSGDPIRDAHIDVPVTFKAGSAQGTTTAKACVVSGCSAQICGEEEMMSTCEFRPEYACYKSAKCERQSNGQCGWTQSPTLLACLKNPPQE